MVKKLNQLKSILAGLLAGEVILLVIAYIFIKSDLLLSLLIYVFIKNMVCICIIFYVASVIRETNYSVSEALNTDNKNALIFGGVALIKYDENRNVVWVSDLLHELGIHIIGHKLLEWQPLLASLFEEEDIKIIDINSRKYQAYNSQTSRLIFLKDVTDLQSVTKEYEDQHPCIAYISIDNYDETIEYADEQKTALIQSTARQTILDWAKDNGIIIRRYKSDAYIAVFNERIYRKQVSEKFKILDIFKEKIEPLGEVMTLSIGIGRGSRVIREQDELAFSALSLAYSRGGDQIAVKSTEEATRFFGGNSEGSEKNNRVRARVIAQSLAGLIKQADNVIIMGHKQSDFDSFGASVGMMAIARAHQKQAFIVLDFDSLEEKTKNIALELANDDRYRDMIISPTRVTEIKRTNSLLISVDNHKPSLAISDNVLHQIKNKVVIDHHRRGEEFIELPILTYLEPSASSTVELLTELFDYQKVEVKLSEREATIMYAGMLIDTNYLRTRVGSRTFQAAAKLKDMLANVSKAYEYLKDDYGTTLSKLSITQSAYQFNPHILIAFGRDDEIYTRAHLAKAGNELMNISDIKAVFTVGFVAKDQVAISARSSQDINVQIIMEKLGGGGHFSMAACQISDKNINEVINDLEEAIRQYLDEREIS